MTHAINPKVLCWILSFHSNHSIHTLLNTSWQLQKFLYVSITTTNFSLSFSRYERGGPGCRKNGHLRGSKGLLHPRGEAWLMTQAPDVASGESADSVWLDSEPNQYWLSGLWLSWREPAGLWDLLPCIIQIWPWIKLNPDKFNKVLKHIRWIALKITLSQAIQIVYLTTLNCVLAFFLGWILRFCHWFAQ